MSGSNAMEGYLKFINSQWSEPPQPGEGSPRERGGVVTISREAGSGAHPVAEALVARLQAMAPRGAAPWTIFDKNLVEKVLADHDLPAKLATFMPEDRRSEMADTMDGLFGLQPSSWTLVRKTAETILRLAEIGNVIVIGRGANLITAHVETALHVRLVGSLERRIEHLVEYRHLTVPQAAEYARAQDQGRSRYVRKYYSAEIDDPLLYDLVVNTDKVGYDEAGGLIADALSMRRLRSPGREAGAEAR